MRHPYDRAGFDDAILCSDDDYEPYGFAAPRLAVHDRLVPWGHQRTSHRDRVIEARVLRQLGGHD